MRLERVELLPSSPFIPPETTNITSSAKVWSNIPDLQNCKPRKRRERIEMNIENIFLVNAPRKIQRTMNFSREEDVCIVSSWLTTSRYTIKGGDEKSFGFWPRVYDRFIVTSGQGGRTECSIQNRWGVISTQCAKFLPYFNEITNEHQSDRTNRDRLEKIRALYAAKNNGEQFKFEHCFDLLKYEKKWLDTLEKSKGTNAWSKSIIRLEQVEPSPLVLHTVATKITPSSIAESKIPDLQNCNERERKEEARALYAANNGGKPFKFEHCFDILKHEKKWLDTLEKSKNTNASFVNSDGVSISSEDTSDSSLNEDRSVGMKQLNIQLRRKQAMSKDRSLSTRMDELLERKIELAHRKLILDEERLEMDIMLVDTTGMEEPCATYWKMRKNEVLRKNGII